MFWTIETEISQTNSSCFSFSTILSTHILYAAVLLFHIFSISPSMSPNKSGVFKLSPISTMSFSVEIMSNKVTPTKRKFVDISKSSQSNESNRPTKKQAIANTLALQEEEHRNSSTMLKSWTLFESSRYKLKHVLRHSQTMLKRTLFSFLQSF